jgi:hypothetical protein
MWFDVPVLALSEAAVPETIADAGVLFDKDESLEHVAERAFELVRNVTRRREVIDKQRLRRREFTLAAVAPRLKELCERIEAASRAALHGVA